MNTLNNFLKVKQIEKILNIKIKNKNIWLEAITHKSWLYFHPEIKILDNERLEFLGDSLLQTITSLYLYQNFTNLSEGEMSLIRASLVNRERLGKIAEKMKIEKFLLISKKLDEKGKNTILGNCLEAIIGAIFLDKGFEEIKKFIEKNILVNTSEIIKKKTYKDPKTFLQEFSQMKYGEIPYYKIVETSGPPHQRSFKVEIYIKNKKVGEGSGSSKQKAEFAAAKNTLADLNNLII